MTRPHPPLSAPQPDRVGTLGQLRDLVLPETALDLGGPAELCPGLVLRADPAARIAASWSSPRGRLLELATRVEAPGDWLGLHLTLGLSDLTGLAWLGFAARTGAGQALVARACLRSGLADGGFHDTFFDRDLLSQAAILDHQDMIAPDQRPDLPQQAPWREFILFLPPTQDIDWALHDLRLFAL